MRNSNMTKGTHSRSSPTHSKSAKSIRSKIHEKSIKKQPQQTAPYFRPDPIRDQIIQRVEKYKSKSNNKSGIKSKTKTQARQNDQNDQKLQFHLFNNQGMQIPHGGLNRANNIVEDLLRRHQEAKQRLKKLKQQRQKQMKSAYPFAPQNINRTNRVNKFNIGSDIIRRNQVWMMQKKKKEIDMQEKAAADQMRNCTFSPQFSSRKQSSFYLRNRTDQSILNANSNIYMNGNQSQYQHKYERKQNKRSVSPQFGTKKKDYTQIEYQMAKKGIISKLMQNSYF